MLPDPSRDRVKRRILKRFIYGQLSLWDAVKIVAGRTQPRMTFTVKDDPASVYWNFHIRPEQQKAFVHYINLPEPFTICPMRCLAHDEPEFILTLNVYEVTGIASGIRAEWSTYVLDPAGVPRYMVLEARSNKYSMDPTDILTRKGRVEHATSEGESKTTVASVEGQLFQSQFQSGGAQDSPSVAPEWVSANDCIYWRGGICDRVFYNAGMANPRLQSIDPSHAEIDDQTHWAQFLERTPKHRSIRGSDRPGNRALEQYLTARQPRAKCPLAAGKYPYPLLQRIADRHGHH